MALPFPPNLDDGEHWLPSDIRCELSQTTAPPHARRLASYSGTQCGSHDFDLLASQLAAFELMDSPKFKMGLGHEFGFGYDGYLNQNPNPLALRNAHQFNLANQLLGLEHDLRRRELYLERKLLAGMDRVYPFRASNGSGRRGGTGVFLPRVDYSTDARKRAKAEKEGTRNNAVNSDLNDKEIKLPQDWAY